MSVLLTVLGISMLIFVHEAGHFLCARLAGVRVHVFSLGFGTRIWGFVRNGTDYRISMLPLGGYVQVAGDDPTSDRRQLRADDLHSKGFLARTLFYSGGVMMNLVLALILFPLVFRSGVEFDAPILGEVFPGGAAWAAGLEQDDRIVSVDGKEMYSYKNMMVEVALANSKRGAELVYRRGEETHSCVVHPIYSRAEGLRLMGIRPARQNGPFELTVLSGSSADKAGLRDGDLLLEFAGNAIDTVDDYTAAEGKWLAAVRGQAAPELSLRVRRPGVSPEADTELEIRFLAKPTQQSIPRLGIFDVGRRIENLKRGVAAVQALGLRVGDEITFINQQPFFGAKLDFGTAPGKISVVVKRDGEDRPVVLEQSIALAQRQALAEAIYLGPVAGELRLRPLAGAAAELAGIRTGDRLQSINGEPMTDWTGVVKTIRANGDKSVELAVVRDTGMVNIQVTPQRDPELGFSARIMPRRDLFQVNGVGASIAAGWTASMDLVKQIYVTLKKLFTGEVSTRNLGGIITIARVSYYTAQEGYPRLFYFLAMLSINLAVINVLPIPVLDGGHLMFLRIERIKGSPVSTAVHSYSQILGLVFVLLLMIYVTYNDILKLNLF